MFYTIYDVIIFKARQNGIEEEKVKKILKKNGFTSKEIKLLKDSCTTLLTEDRMSIILNEFDLTELEINLMLGIIPEEYEKSYLNNISSIARILKKEKKEINTKINKVEFET